MHPTKAWVICTGLAIAGLVLVFIGLAIPTVEVERETEPRLLAIDGPTGQGIYSEPRTYTADRMTLIAVVLVVAGFGMILIGGIIGTVGSVCPQCDRLSWWHYLPKKFCQHCGVQFRSDDWYRRENWHEWLGSDIFTPPLAPETEGPTVPKQHNSEKRNYFEERWNKAKEAKEEKIKAKKAKAKNKNLQPATVRCSGCGATLQSGTICKFCRKLA